MFKKIIFTLVILNLNAFASDINWAKDYHTGIKQAKKQNKPVMFIFSNQHCKWCNVLENTTFKNEKVIKALNKDFISIISYTNKQDYTPKELWRPGTPAIWFLKKDGAPMFDAINGAIDDKTMIKSLSIVKTRFDRINNDSK